MNEADYNTIVHIYLETIKSVVNCDISEYFCSYGEWLQILPKEVGWVKKRSTLLYTDRERFIDWEMALKFHSVQVCLLLYLLLKTVLQLSKLR